MTRSGRSTPGHRREILAALLCLLAGLFVPVSLFAGDLLELNVSDSKGVYRIDVEMVVYAPVEDVWHVLTDYTHIYRLNNSIIESEILPVPDDNVVRVRTLMNECVFVFCFDIERVEDVRVTDNGELKALVVKELSNIESGATTWRIQPSGVNTHVSYQGSIEPGFGVFPVIGNYLARSKLRKQILLTLENVERISRVEAGLDVERLDVEPESGVVLSNLP